MNQIRVVQFADLFSRANPVVRNVEASRRRELGEVLEELAIDPASVVVVRNGSVVPREGLAAAELVAGDEVHLAPSPGTGGEIILAAIAIASAALSAYLVSQVRLPAAASSSTSEERRFGFNRFSNDAFAGDVIPTVFGYRPSFGGKVIARVPIESPDGSGDEKIRILICAGHGPIAQLADRPGDFDAVPSEEIVSGLELNDTPVSSFPGVKVWARMGTADQAVIPGFEDVDTLVEVGSGGFELRNTSGVDRAIGDPPSGEAVEFTTTDPVEGFVTRVRFPEGCYKLSSSAQVEIHTVRYRVRHKQDGGVYGDWRLVTVRQDRQSAFWSSPRFDNVEAPGEGVVRTIQVERLTKEPADATVRDAMVWDSVRQIVYAENNYADFALLALEVVANEQLQTVPNVSFSMRGYAGLRIWDGISSPSNPVFVTGYSANPAWIALEVLTNRRFGAGSLYSDANIHFPSLIAWALVCDEQVERPPEGSAIFRSRYRYNYVLQDQRDSAEWVWSICQSARCRPANVGNLWRFLYDGPQAVSVESFTDRSIAIDEETGAMRASYRRVLTTGGVKVPNRIVVQFENEQREGLPDALAYPRLGDLWLEEETVREQSVRLEGITDPDQAAAQAIYLMNRIRYLSRTVRFVTTRPVLVTQPGDRFECSMSLAGYGLSSGAILPGSTDSTLLLDASVTLPAGETFGVRVSHLNGVVELRTIVSAAGDYPRGTPLLLQTPLSQAPEDGAEYAIARSGIEAKPFLCTRVAFLDAERYEIELEGIEYVEGIYSDLYGEVEVPTWSSLPSPTTPPGPVIDLRVFERVHPVTEQSQAHLSWNQTANDTSITGSFRVYWRPVGTATWSLIPNAVVSLRAAVVDLFDMDRGYEFVVVAVSVAGAYLSPYDPRHPIAVLVLGLAVPPPPPPNPVTPTQVSGNTYRLDWTAVEDAVGYQVLSSLSTTLPKAGAEDGIVVARTEETFLAGLELTPGQACRFYVRSIGRNGRMSFTATAANIPVPGTPAGQTIKRGHIFDPLAGTLTNLTWNAAAGWLELIDPSLEGVWETNEDNTGAASLCELTFRLDPGNDSRDLQIAAFPHRVPSIAADQWGIRTSPPKRVGMIFPPYPDETLGYVVELRIYDGASWSSYAPIGVYESEQTMIEKVQFRVRISRTIEPYRPAIRGLRYVVTH